MWLPQFSECAPIPMPIAYFLYCSALCLPSNHLLTIPQQRNCTGPHKSFFTALETLTLSIYLWGPTILCTAQNCHFMVITLLTCLHIRAFPTWGDVLILLFSLTSTRSDTEKLIHLLNQLLNISLMSWSWTTGFIFKDKYKFLRIRKIIPNSLKVKFWQNHCVRGYLWIMAQHLWASSWSFKESGDDSEK